MIDTSIQELETVKYGVKYEIDPIQWSIQSLPCAIDVEDDEHGNFLFIGFHDGRRGYGFTTLSDSVRAFLSTGLFAGHNAITDFVKLREWGCQIKDDQLVWDTMLIQHIQDSSQRTYSLTDVSERVLGVKYRDYETVTGRGKNHKTFNELPLEVMINKNMMDVYCTWHLWQHQKQRDYGRRVETYYRELEAPVARIFHQMEQRGVIIDRDYLAPLKLKLETRRAFLRDEINQIFGPRNWNSPKQVLEGFHAQGIYPIWQRQASTDQRALIYFMDRRGMSQYLEHQKLDTLLTNYVEKYLAFQTREIHPHFHQTGTRTGRPSCSKPNLLQIPKRDANGRLVRKMFIARPGMKFGSFDFGQIEPRGLAHMSQDPALCDLFNKGIDFHDFTRDRVEKLQGNRDKAKILNLSVGYRATSKSVSYQLQTGESEAQDHIDEWWALFPDLQVWEEKFIAECSHIGYCTTLLGRRIKIDNLDHPQEWKRAAAARQLINNLIQGSCAEIMKLAMLAVDRAAIPDLYQLCQVYDELLIEAPQERIEEIAIQVGHLMKTCCSQLTVPLIVDAGIGANWAELEKRKV